MSMSSRSAAQQKLARHVWVLMFDFLMRTSPDRTKSLARRGLTPNDARALSALDVEDGRTMRSLAEMWGCDASNATWVVDRLEKFGLARRYTASHDRRVKLVVLTPKGERTRAELMEEFHRPPADLLALDRSDLEALQRLLQKLAVTRPGGTDE
jgi:DNA-binding MarR family transcriptional regulator